MGHYIIGHDTFGVYMMGNYAYVTDSDEGFLIIDIRNRSNPIKMSQYAGNMYDVYIKAEYAYVAGLEILDVSNPSNPVEIGQFADG